MKASKSTRKALAVAGWSEDSMKYVKPIPPPEA